SPNEDLRLWTFWPDPSLTTRYGPMNPGPWIGRTSEARLEEGLQRRKQRLRLVDQDVLGVQPAVDHDQRLGLARARVELLCMVGWNEPVRAAVRDEQGRGCDAIDGPGEGGRRTDGEREPRPPPPAAQDQGRAAQQPRAEEVVIEQEQVARGGDQGHGVERPMSRGGQAHVVATE